MSECTVVKNLVLRECSKWKFWKKHLVKAHGICNTLWDHAKMCFFTCTYNYPILLKTLLYFDSYLQ